MRPFDDFVADAVRTGVHLDVRPRGATTGIDADATFHTPLLALAILVIARARKELETYEASVWTGATLAAHFSGLHDSRRRLEWSLQLRKRCADALVFLENVGLVTIDIQDRHVIRVSDDGRKFLTKLFSAIDETGLLARGLLKAHSVVQSKGLDLL